MIKNIKKKLKEFDRNYDKTLDKIKNKTILKSIVINDKKGIQNKLQKLLKTQVRLRLELSGINIYFRGKLQETIFNDEYEISQSQSLHNSIIFKRQNIANIVIMGDDIVIYLKYKNK